MTGSNLLACAAVCLVFAPMTAFAACPSGQAVSGIVQSVTGAAGRITLLRGSGESSRPVPLDPLCEGDTLVATEPGAEVMLRLSGAQTSTILHSPFQFPLPRRTVPPTARDNLVALWLDTVLPRIRRITYEGVSRSPSSPPRWGAAGLADNSAVLESGSRSIFVRWDGGSGPYRIVLSRSDGEDVAVIETEAKEARFPSRRWASGAYRMRLYHAGGELLLEGGFTMGGAAPADNTPSLDWAGAEVRAVANAVRLAGLDPPRWSFEALQVLSAAPAEGFDRTSIYELIASPVGH